MGQRKSHGTDMGRVRVRDQWFVLGMGTGMGNGSSMPGHGYEAVGTAT